VLILTIEQDVK